MGHLEAAYLGGWALVARKRRCPSGAWQNWQREILGVSTRTAAACVRVFLATEKYGGAVPTACLDGSLWTAERALPKDTCWAAADIKPDADAVARPTSYYHGEVLHRVAANQPLLWLLRPLFDHIRDSDDPLAAAAYLAMVLQSFAIVDVGPADATVRAGE